jgi:hypothetical protein
MNRDHSGRAFFVLVAWVSLPWMASCSPGDAAPAGGHPVHPKQRAPMPVASADEAQDGGPPQPAESFSPVDKAIANDCVPQPPPTSLVTRFPELGRRMCRTAIAQMTASAAMGFATEGTAPSSGRATEPSGSDV